MGKFFIICTGKYLTLEDKNMEMGMAMPITDTEYFNITISKTPEVKAEKEYTIKKGDSLWGIAKNTLGKNAKNGEILDYTYKIAKLNNLKSPKEMSSLKINDKIYLPENVNNKNTKAEEKSKPAKTKPTETKPVKQEEPTAKTNKIQHKKQTKTQSNTTTSQIPEYLQAKKEIYNLPKINFEKTNFVSDWKFNKNEVKIPFAANPPKKTGKAAQTHQTAPAKQIQKQVPVQKAKTPKAKTNFELGFEDLKNAIVNTDKKFLELEYGGVTINGDLFTVYKTDEKETYKRKQLANFTIDNNGTLRNMSFDGRKNVFPTRYDYDMNKAGKITQSDEFRIKAKTLGNVNQADFKQIEKVLSNIVKEYKQTHKNIDLYY